MQFYAILTGMPTWLVTRARSMHPALIQACETFSEGNAKAVAEHISPEVKWEVVGEKSIEGLDVLLEFCAEMTSEAPPNFKNQHTTIGDGRIVVEGTDQQENGVAYCDAYAIAGGKITEIRSYCITPDGESKN